jgi:hypothetical protein
MRSSPATSSRSSPRPTRARRRHAAHCRSCSRTTTWLRSTSPSGCCRCPPTTNGSGPRWCCSASSWPRAAVSRCGRRTGSTARHRVSCCSRAAARRGTRCRRDGATPRRSTSRSSKVVPNRRTASSRRRCGRTRTCACGSVTIPRRGWRGRATARWHGRVRARGRSSKWRAHLAWRGHPVVGDDRYGTPAARLCLHALRLALPHPRTGAPLVLEAPLPPALPAALG